MSVGSASPELVAGWTFDLLSDPTHRDLKVFLRADGQKLSLVVANGKVTAGSANVVATDVAASNGVIHVVDSVLLPQ